ncbi:hypothetical protein GCM10009765_17810 [Fodinicola feengrottensis]|uniref:NERD domain-containing protein n=1 Tax=Fodinicola feengrottensis TaxID=435914 RepID=A0ABN2GCF4_9ACTN
MSSMRLGGTQRAPSGVRRSFLAMGSAAFEQGEGARAGAHRHRRGIDSRTVFALVIAAGLVGIAIVVEQWWVAAGLAVGLAAGLCWVSGLRRHSVVGTATAIMWWAVTAPVVAAVAGLHGPAADPVIQLSQSAGSILFTGVLVWLLAVLLPSRSSWLSIMVCWAINASAAGPLALLAPGVTVLIGWTMIATYLCWRTGAVGAYVTRVRERSRVSRLYEQSTGEQREIIDRLADAPRKATVLHQMSVPRDFGARLQFDAYVVAQTGVYGVMVADAIGRLQLNVSATRRVAVENRSMDDLLLDAAVSAYAVSDALRVRVLPLVALPGATFPPQYPGVVPATVSPRELDGPVDVVMLEPSLLVDRICYGETIYTPTQLDMIVRRARSVLYPTEQAPAHRLPVAPDRLPTVPLDAPPARPVPRSAPVPVAPRSQVSPQVTRRRVAQALQRQMPVRTDFPRVQPPPMAAAPVEPVRTGPTWDDQVWGRAAGSESMANQQAWKPYQVAERIEAPAPVERPVSAPTSRDSAELILGPGVEVMWFDDSGAWSGWVCATGVVRLSHVPNGAVDTGLNPGDRVVWVVARTEWDRAIAENRAVSPSLIQPVRAEMLQTV